MTEQLLHDLELGAHASQESRVCVAECMPSEMLLDAQFQRPWTNEFPQNRLAPIWLPTAVAPAREHPILRFAIRLLSPPLQESVDDERMNWHRLLRSLRLARPDHTVDYRPRHIDRLFFEVDVTPLQAKEFTLAQSG